MKGCLPVFTILLLVSLACRFTTSDSTPMPMIEPVETLPTTVAYKTISGIDPDLLSLDIHAPANAGNAPVVMWVHGGGYAIGDKAYQMPDKITLFNAQGPFKVVIQRADKIHRLVGFS